MKRVWFMGNKERPAYAGAGRSPLARTRSELELLDLDGRAGLFESLLGFGGLFLGDGFHDGAQTLDGIEIRARQGALAVRMWTNADADWTAMRAELEDSLARLA